MKGKRRWAQECQPKLPLCLSSEREVDQQSQGAMEKNPFVLEIRAQHAGKGVENIQTHFISLFPQYRYSPFLLETSVWPEITLLRRRRRSHPEIPKTNATEFSFLSSFYLSPSFHLNHIGTSISNQNHQEPQNFRVKLDSVWS